MTEGFHLKNGLYFKRLPNGRVRISLQGDVQFTLETDPNKWASVVAAVSGRGETRESWEDALYYHNRRM